MNRKQLFVYTLRDIEKKLTEGNPYEILMIAGLLRKLLLDGHPLADQVNTKRLKIRFIINDRPVPEDSRLVLWSIEDGLDPDTAVPHLRKPIEVPRDKLLSTKVLKIGNNISTVKDVLLHLAHIEGAIHAESAKNEKDKILDKFIQKWKIGGISATLRLLKAIARIVLKGLKPLES